MGQGHFYGCLLMVFVYTLFVGSINLRYVRIYLWLRKLGVFDAVIGETGADPGCELSGFFRQSRDFHDSNDPYRTFVILVRGTRSYRTESVHILVNVQV